MTGLTFFGRTVTVTFKILLIMTVFFDILQMKVFIRKTIADHRMIGRQKDR